MHENNTLFNSPLTHDCAAMLGVFSIDAPLDITFGFVDGTQHTFNDVLPSAWAALPSTLATKPIAEQVANSLLIHGMPNRDAKLVAAQRNVCCDCGRTLDEYEEYEPFIRTTVSGEREHVSMCMDCVSTATLQPTSPRRKLTQAEIATTLREVYPTDYDELD